MVMVTDFITTEHFLHAQKSNNMAWKKLCNKISWSVALILSGQCHQFHIILIWQCPQFQFFILHPICISHNDKICMLIEGMSHYWNFLTNIITPREILLCEKKSFLHQYPVTFWGTVFKNELKTSTSFPINYAVVMKCWYLHHKIFILY
jgi:hypothetical protein